MTGEPWKHVCIIGFGGHARNKLAPAVKANGQSLSGIVSRHPNQIDGSFAETQIFPTVDAALQGLPNDTLFIVASPPVVHFDQVMPLAVAGRDIVVEKPAFVTAAQARSAIAAVRDSGAVLIEGFMQRHTLTHSRFLAEWDRIQPVELDFVFTIPEAPPETFRSDRAIGSSNLFDMGCYLLAALSDAGLPLGSLEIDRLDTLGKPDSELLHLSGAAGNVSVRARIGLSSAYENRIEIRSSTSSASFSPFIYGRPGPRTFSTTRPGATEVNEFDDLNAFEAMLSVPREDWTSSCDARYRQIIDIAENLERLGRRLEMLRCEA